MKSLLSKAKKIDVSAEPFPHLIIHEPLEAELCSQLIAEYPTVKTITKGLKYSSNQRFSYSAWDILGTGTTSPLWEELVRVHTSQDFLREVIALFAGAIRQTYPELEGQLGALESLKAGIRHRDDFSTAEVLLDAQICLNTPVRRASSVRGPHVDHPNKLFAGLYYLRHPEDTSTGGDLELYRFTGRRDCFVAAEVAHLEAVEVVKTVKYERNVLVIFLNSIEALHGVTVRSKTPSPRYLFNLVGEVSQPLFDLNAYQTQEKPALPASSQPAWWETSTAVPARVLRKLKSLV